MARAARPRPAARVAAAPRTVKPTDSEALRASTGASVDVRRMPSYQEAFDQGLVEGRQQGFEAGRLEGLELGMQQAREQAEADRREQARLDLEERSTRTQRFEAVARQLDDQMAKAIEELQARYEVHENELVALALSLCEELLARELVNESGELSVSIRRALQLAPEGVHVDAHLNPDDVALADFEVPGLQVVSDASVPQGGCVLRAGDSDIDGSMSGALERLRATFDEIYGG